jgi:hypothetical protein
VWPFVFRKENNPNKSKVVGRCSSVRVLLKHFSTIAVRRSTAVVANPH